jgi:hypothetical protein
MHIPKDSTSCKRRTVPEFLLGRQHFRSLLCFCAHYLVAAPGGLIHRPVQSGCCSCACLLACGGYSRPSKQMKDRALAGSW